MGRQRPVTSPPPFSSQFFREKARKLARARPDPCAICLGQMDKGTMVIPLTACRHFFHAECLLAWLTRSEVCPLCKRSTLPDAKPKKKSWH